MEDTGHAAVPGWPAAAVGPAVAVPIGLDDAGLIDMVNAGVALGGGSVAIAGLADGGHVVLFTGRGDGNPDPYQFGVYVRRYDALGRPAGDVQLVNETLGGSQSSASVAALPGGGWAVVWLQSTSFGAEPRLRLFDAAGQPLGGEIRLTGFPRGELALRPEGLLGLANGDLVVTGWIVDGGRIDHVLQVLDPQGQPRAPVLRFDAGPNAPAEATAVVRDVEARADGGMTALVGFHRGPLVVPGLWLAHLESDGRLRDGALHAIDGLPEGLRQGARLQALGADWLVTYGTEEPGSPVSGHVAWVRDDGTLRAAELSLGPWGGDDAHAVAELPDGGFVEFLAEHVVDWAWRLSGQRHDAAGRAVGDRFAVAPDGEPYLGGPVLPQVRPDGVIVLLYSTQQGLRQVLLDDLTADVVPIADWQPPARLWVPPWQDTHVDTGPDGTGWLAWEAPGPYERSVVRLQRVDADGRAIDGPGLLAARAVDGVEQRDPDLALLADGRTVVVWTRHRVADQAWDVMQRVLGADGRWEGWASAIGTSRRGWQEQAEVEARPDGGWVVAWRERHDWPRPPELTLRAFEADGQGGAVVQVDQLPQLRFDDSHALAVLRDGRTVLVWSDEVSRRDTYDLEAQLFDRHGRPMGGPWMVATERNELEVLGDVAAAGDGFVIVWSRSISAFEPTRVVAQRHGTDGRPVGDAVLVDTAMGGSPSSPRVVGHDDGRWAVLWMSDVTGRPQVHGQQFEADGQRHGGEFLLRLDDRPLQDEGAIALSSAVWRDDGSLLLAWGASGEDAGHGQTLVPAGADGWWFGG